MKMNKTDQTLNRGISESARLCQKEIVEQLVEAALKEGISIDTNSIAVAFSCNVIMVNAAVDGLAKIDPISYEDGILTNFVYIDSPRTSLATGFYAVTIVADFVRIGRIEIRSEFSQRGELVAATSGFGIVTSLRVPPNAPPSVVPGIGLMEIVDKPTAPVPPFLPDFIYITCSNGINVCESLGQDSQND